MPQPQLISKAVSDGFLNNTPHDRIVDGYGRFVDWSNLEGEAEIFLNRLEQRGISDLPTVVELVRDFRARGKVVRC